MITPLIKNRWIFVGTVIIGIAIVAGAFAEVLSPADPIANNLDYKFSPPSSSYPLGNDELGRCILSRLLYGARCSIGLSMLLMIVLGIVTIPIAMIAACKGGIIDKLFLWSCDISMAFPPMVLVLAITGILGNGTVNLIFSILFSCWGWYSRIIRTYSLSELSKSYVTYALTGGASILLVLSKEVFPNILPGLITLFCLGIGDMILMISGYSFLGIGLPSHIPEWGAMIGQGKSCFLREPSHVIYPGVCVMLTVFGFNILGEGIRKNIERLERR